MNGVGGGAKRREEDAWKMVRKTQQIVKEAVRENVLLEMIGEMKVRYEERISHGKGKEKED